MKLFSTISGLSVLALAPMPSAVLAQDREVCFTETATDPMNPCANLSCPIARDRYPYAVTEWYCGSGSTCCSVPDDSDDGELQWGCIDTDETCSRDTWLTSDNMGFEITDDGYGDDGDDGDDGEDDDSDNGARGSAASLLAVVGGVALYWAALGM
ncbi:uncharacterized protein F5Z01DRAFT_635752 [Emericellopsis atlantica]|uniref:Uncharacterized protein n=1 Tax=Emericellopsis atlantica TaxID=2614577 RepID=A0A9P8CQC4_9HYPO|nr:uncharacterized protein F5Z01DRAFT_635752 [Emericellopsis atlantica]KAG9255478.1 hypothetical protein F5Z01DRAFT_635752 [Emericellopsis atlantica]